MLTLDLENKGNITYSNIIVKDLVLGTLFSGITLNAGQSLKLQKELIITQSTALSCLMTMDDNTGKSQTYQLNELYLAINRKSNPPSLHLVCTAEKDAISAIPETLNFQLDVSNTGADTLYNIRITHATTDIYTIRVLRPGQSATLEREFSLSMPGKYQFTVAVLDSQGKNHEFLSNPLEIGWNPAAAQVKTVPRLRFEQPVYRGGLLNPNARMWTEMPEVIKAWQGFAGTYNTIVSAAYRHGVMMTGKYRPSWAKTSHTGWSVRDLSAYPVVSYETVTVSREALLKGGLLLVNQWHRMPGDFILVEDDIKPVGAETNYRVPVADANVRLLDNVITALDKMIAAAKGAGQENYIAREGFRDAATQLGYWDYEVAKYTARYSGDALIEKVRERVAYPATSDYHTAMSVNMDVYNRNDSVLNNTKFQESAQ
ncbi:MAG TPA: D-alanyl-D-alanine carboxypeptidase family protein, partial [Clostridia bacterium]|nr:D-alanyl-D-alanine carboxypeptidase family protein [Clostridia bacterium]